MRVLAHLLDTSPFPARWHCGTWTEALGWTHIIADSLIFGAYVGIPIALAVVIARRSDETLFPALLWLFVAFIVSCGFTHAVEALIFWHPVYRISAVLKVITAAVSITTLFALIRVLPAALALPGAAERNVALQREIVERRRVEAQLRRSEERLRAANTELQRFAAATSHDLRSPLRGIRTLGEWVRDDAGARLPEDSRAHLDLMIERLKRVDALVDGLLRYAKADHEESEAVPVALAPLFDDLSTWSIGETTTLALEIGAMPEYVGGSATALRQVLANLLDNSRKHHDRSHGVVQIEAQPTDDGRVAFVVRDDGPGIPEAAAAQVFDLFRTLASDSDAAEQNLGMGLAIARRLVERAGGSIALVQHVGRGATFTFTWPAAPEGDLS